LEHSLNHSYYNKLIADPGALLVAEAHLLNIRVIPLVGPSSFILAIMGSGLNGQSFTFNGYLPIQETERIAVLKKLEEESRKTNRTQLFMETPYRNVTLWQTLLKVLHGNTRLCLAAGLTSPTEILVTKTVNQWKQFAVPAINKVPALFLFLAE
jgi:16S rRNA (cytidine1402-2'-O)-methyltransferase